MPALINHDQLATSARIIRRLSLCILLGAFASGVDAARAQEKRAKPPQPNILFILTDDQGWPTLGSYGGKLVSTPHIDSLAHDGMRFTQAYVTSQCTPTRATLLTGQQTARNRMWHVIPYYDYPWAQLREPKYVENLPRETFTLPKALKAAGYTTGIVGKWHLTANADGHYEQLKPEAAPFYGFDYSPVGWKPGQNNDLDKGVDWLTDRAMEFIEQNRERPFFCYLAHHTLHSKVHAPEELVAKYRARGFPETGLHNATYLAAIEHLDNSVGRLLAKLDTLGLAQKTVVIFLSDNGGQDEAYDNAPLRLGKGTLYEGGLRVPLLVRWPGQVPPATVCETPVHAMDFYPTLLEMAGVPPPPDHLLDGVSLLPLLKNPHAAWPRNTLYWYQPLYDMLWGDTPAAAIRKGDWKLIEFFGDHIPVKDGNQVQLDQYKLGRRLELYDLREDLREAHDLASERPEKTMELERALHEWMKTMNAPIPELNPDYDPTRALVRPSKAGVKPSLRQ